MAIVVLSLYLYNFRHIAKSYCSVRVIPLRFKYWVDKILYQKKKHYRTIIILKNANSGYFLSSLQQLHLELGFVPLLSHKSKSIYTTKGRDRFHWAATPLKTYKVGNICYMTYWYSLLFFLNLSLKHIFPHRKRQFLGKYSNPETVIVPCFNVSRMPNRRTFQSKIEDIVHCKCISLLN